ncbi:hypothetical protein BY458DRAFT_524516 [Sporodiniella umbellata]|nr:hypothetical protein BY458DRAFT_524516 [Sporodiniella umbellata]
MPSITSNAGSNASQLDDTLPSFGYSQDKQIYMLPPPSSLPGYYLPLPSLEERQSHKTEAIDSEEQVIEAAKILMNISRCTF